MIEKNREKNILKIVSILVIGLIFGITYSWYVVTKTANTVNKIKAGKLELELDDKTSSGIKLLNALPTTYQEGIKTTEYTFSIENKGSIKAEYSLTLDDESSFVNDSNETVNITSSNKLSDNYIRYILVKGAEEKTAAKSKLLSEVTDRVLDSGELNVGEKIEYKLQIWIDSRAGENNTQNDVMNKYFNARLNLVGEQVKIYNKNILEAYTYNQTTGDEHFCVTGDEETCQESTCYKTKTEGSCPAGTIIKYKVNNSTTETFHVMYDDASSITMQTQKNTGIALKNSHFGNLVSKWLS